MQATVLTVAKVQKKVMEARAVKELKKQLASHDHGPLDPSKYVNNRPIKEKGDKWVYELMQDFILHYVTPDGRHLRIKIKAGFIYDGASVPRWLWSLSGLHPDGPMRNASLVHDLIYVLKGLLDQSSDLVEVYEHSGGHFKRITYDFTRKECDKLFKRMLLQDGLKKSKANLAYVGVRLGGAFLWKPWE
jgi:hypothetical protein